MSKVLFHRNFNRFRGGHLKVFDYYHHVRSAAGHEAAIRFTPDTVWDETNPWHDDPHARRGPPEGWDPDVLFLAGLDWRRLTAEQRQRPQKPIINLIQHVDHGNPDFAAHAFLKHPAIRICVGGEVRESIEPYANGPLFTIPVAIDLAALPPPRAAGERDIDITVLALKDPPLGAEIHRRLARSRHRVVLIERPVPRPAALDLLARARVAVLLPNTREGAYLPALESMALGTVVVCAQYTGGEGFCRDGETCLMAPRKAAAIADRALSAAASSPAELAPLLAAGRAASAARDLENERRAFLDLLDQVDELWE